MISIRLLLSNVQVQGLFIFTHMHSQKVNIISFYHIFYMVNTCSHMTERMLIEISLNLNQVYILLLRKYVRTFLPFLLFTHLIKHTAMYILSNIQLLIIFYNFLYVSKCIHVQKSSKVMYW